MDSWSAPSGIGDDAPRLPGAAVPVRLYDSARQGAFPTSPTGRATMYVCGITPYDAAHLGHAATMITFDLVNRLWRDAGHEVAYVQNVTDIDDPLLERAERDGEDWKVLAMRETALFREDMEALRIIPPDHYIGAVESIPVIAERVVELLERGAAYRLTDGTGDVYFDISAAPSFGYESNLDRSTMIELFGERGGDPDRDGKRDRLDPVAVARDPRRRAGLGRWPARAGPTRLAHRVHRHRAEPARRDHRRAGRRQRPALPAPRVLGRARRGAHRQGAIRRALRARRHDRPQRREDEQVARQPRLRVAPARRRHRPDGGAAGAHGRPLPRRPALDRRDPQGRRAAPRPMAGRFGCALRPLRHRSRGGRTRKSWPTTSTPPARWPSSTAGPTTRSPGSATTRARRR